MRLGEFIARDMDSILRRWDAFAATRLPAAERMQASAIRDHGREILEAIVVDLATPQTPAEQHAKSVGLAPVKADAPQSAAQTHAVLRAKVGFSIEQLASEYRALRASVLTAWVAACRPELPDLDDMVRFNEAIDQALAESIGHFSAHVTRTRNLLLGMLTHDLRSPLQTIQITARFLKAIDAGGEMGRAAERLVRSGARMQTLLDDLTDFSRTELGVGIRVAPRDIDLRQVCAEELEQIRASYADRGLVFESTGDCRGHWDPGRMQQLLNNLVVNAFMYGDPGSAVEVALFGEPTEVCLSVTNAGQAIEAETLAAVFDPLRRGHDDAALANKAGLGLGLYIASEIARAHGGTVSASSANGRTSFVVRLPRHRLAATG